MSVESEKTGMFATCLGEWDEKEKKFKPKNVTEVAQCCINQCIKPVEFCQKYCESNSGSGKIYNTSKMLNVCLDTCKSYRDLCTDICELSSPYFSTNNIYMKCAQEKGCVKPSGNSDSECVKKNGEDIYNCCMQTCVPTEELECKSYCDFSHNLAMNKDRILYHNLDSKMVFTSKKDKTVYIVIFAVIAGVIISLLVLNKLKLKFSYKN